MRNYTSYVPHAIDSIKCPLNEGVCKMYKDELIQIHQFLVYVLKNLEDEYTVKDECKEYICLNISPHHIHRTKAEHKYAIFVLSTAISEVIANNNGGTSQPISQMDYSNWLKDLKKN